MSMRRSYRFVTVAVGTLIVSCFGSRGFAQVAEDSYVSDMRYVAVDASSDSAATRDLSASASLTVGRHVWLRGGGGRIVYDEAELDDLSFFGAGFGGRFDAWQFATSFNSYGDGNGYRQRDLSGAVDWLGERFMLGLDVFHRRTDNSLDTTASFPSLGLSNIAIRIDEQLTGNGLGLHASVDVTDALTILLGGMSFDYESDYQVSSSTNPALIQRLLSRRPTIAELFYLNSSGVTRTIALLEKSFDAGLQYRFDRVGLTARYFHDTALDTGEVSQTGTLGAEVAIGEHWLVAPLVGHSSSEDTDSVTFGSLSIRFSW